MPRSDSFPGEFIAKPRVAAGDAGGSALPAAFRGSALCVFAE